MAVLSVGERLEERLGHLVTAMRWSELPSAVQDRARDRLLDALSTAIAGRQAPVTRAVLAGVAAGDGPCTILPSGAAASAQDAALVNGVAVHALLFEDIHLASADHPGAVVVPAALAAAEHAARVQRRRLSLADLLTAIVCGYEVQLRLGSLAAPGMIARGFRTTSVLGAIAAAAATASAWRLPRAQADAALALGANLAGGVIEAWSHGTMEPYVQAGLAARNGVLAAQLALSGVATAPDTLTGANGYLRAFADVHPGAVAADTAREDASKATGASNAAGGAREASKAAGGAREANDVAGGARERWRIVDVMRKPYPVSGAKLGAVDSALALLEDGVDARRARRIVVRLPTLAREYPGGDRKGPFATMTQAQDSTQFCVAAALLGRPMSSVRTFTEGFADAAVSELTQRIELVGEVGRELTRIELDLDDGTTATAEADRRDAHRPTIALMSAKLRELTSGVWPAAVADAVVTFVTGPAERPLGELSELIGR